MASVLGRALARYLTRRVAVFRPATASAASLAAALQPGDVLLVEGDTRLSVTIKYLTQSTWSHAALFVGARADLPARASEPKVFVEADLNDGVRALPLSYYAEFHTRICRPVGLTAADTEAVCRYAVQRLGHRYDLKNVFDLARYLLRTPPVPTRLRRRLLALGSGDPTRAICSTLIAQAFQSVHYPILPHVERERSGPADCDDCVRELYEVRHHSLFAPRDFDISPYFAVIKPTVATGFDYRQIAWRDRPASMETPA
ncbi:MAG: YiiX/YebB-like N1pC/P60 family cysteine hydrolase [Betaproteobacteria bacterium]